MYDAIMVFAKARETERRNAADSHYSEQCRNGQKFLLERLKQMSVKSQNNRAYSANKDPVIPKNDDNKGSGDIQNFNSSLLD